jgi:hypothetical protein
MMVPDVEGSSTMGKRTGKAKKDAASRSILINFVLDASGSMDVIRDATISGFNEFKNDQAREDGEVRFTLTLFDTDITRLCAAVPVREVPDLDVDNYQPGGCTALYDAIGHTMRITDDYVAVHKPDQVLFVIMTDGEENASREFSRERIFQMIQDRQKLADYDFIYLGANQDSYAVGAQMGVADGRMLDYGYSPAAASEVMHRVSDNVKAHRRSGRVQAPAYFCAEMDALGAIDADAWRAMSDDEKAKHLQD